MKILWKYEVDMLKIMDNYHRLHTLNNFLLILISKYYSKIMEKNTYNFKYLKKNSVFEKKT
jgi:hypothetical protein